MIRITNVGAMAGDLIVLRIETDQTVLLTANDSGPIKLCPASSLELKINEYSALTLQIIEEASK
jgi:hypothetical protein